MKSFRVILLISIVLILGVGCSDDTSGDPDSGSPNDANKDSVLDGSSDAVTEGGAADLGDGGVTPAKAPEKVTCTNPAMTPPTSGTCTVTKGTGTAILLRGTILAPDKVYENGHLLIDKSGSGKIVCLGCDCKKSTGYTTATVVECAKGVISPGLINTHDHLGWARYYPMPTAERYDHRHEWRVGKNGKTKVKYGGSSYKTESVALAELRMILGGATAIMGANTGASKLLRNLDGKSEGLTAKAVYDATFPLGDTSGTLIKSGCGYKSKPTESTVKAASAYVPHVSEGGITEARNEFLCLSSTSGGGVNVVLKNSAFIHSVGLKAADMLKMAGAGTMVIWSPRTNISLYGYTADIITMHRLGVEIALGTDWTISGSMNMLRELSCAASYNKDQLGGFFADWQLWNMATGNAADSCGVGAEIGKLKTGYWADVAVFDGASLATADWAHKAVVQGSVKTVALVLRAGEVVHGDTVLVKALDSAGGTGCEALTDCLSAKSICAKRELGKTISEIKTTAMAASPAITAAELYPLFFCKTPDKEPSCTPTRPNEYPKTGITDTDGDGVADATDNCKTVFNPILKMYSGAQADADNDKAGDACDVCPLDANTSNCKTKYDPNDRDNDGFTNDKDNCPDDYNKDQKDTDKDQKGDVCDACPNDYNPGTAPCPFSIKELRDPSLKKQPSTGTAVQVKKVVVTAVPTTASGAKGFYVREGIAAYEAIYVYTGSTNPQKATDSTVLKPGHELEISGKYITFYSIDEIGSATSIKITNVGSTITAPAPVAIKTADLQPKSATGEKYESHLVKVSKVTVAVGPTTKSDAFWVTDSGSPCTGTAPACTLVGDFFYDNSKVNSTPAAKAAQTFSSITGVVNGYNSAYSLDPGQASDLVTP